jgi:hypothetical protein
MGSDYPNNKYITNVCKWIFAKNIGISWPKLISNTELWEDAEETPIILEIRRRKLRSISHSLRKGDESVEKQALHWNSQGTRSRERPKQAWKRMVLETAGKCGKTRSEVKRLASDRVGWKSCTNALCS